MTAPHQKVRPSKWTREQEILLLELVNTRSVAEIALIVGHSPSGVYAALDRLRRATQCRANPKPRIATQAWMDAHVESPAPPGPPAPSAPKRSAADLAKPTDAELFAVNPRPRTRSDCLALGPNAARPCPWVSCRYHLYLDIQSYNNSIKLNFPAAQELTDLPATCALDVVDRHPDGLTLEDLGKLLQLTRERVRQIEAKAVKTLARRTNFNMRNHEILQEPTEPWSEAAIAGFSMHRQETPWL